MFRTVPWSGLDKDRYLKAMETHVRLCNSAGRAFLDHIRSLTSALEAEKKRREGAPHAEECRKVQCCGTVDGPTCRQTCNCWKAEETTK